MTCSVTDCQQPVKGRGLCNKHLIRLRKYGDVNAYQINAPYKKPCLIDGCARKPHARGLCQQHYDQERLDNPRRYCSVDSCQDPVKGRGLCNKHLIRLRKHGDLHHERERDTWPSGAAHPSWVGDNAAYETVHLRLGPVKARVCTHCGAAADDWAYDHTDADEKISTKGFPYSTDPSRYFPLCRPCHIIFDAT